MLEQRDIDYVVHAHTEHPRKPSKAVRKWDGATPYWVHPLWCATAILAETELPADVRNNGGAALLYHDVLEDTTEALPGWLEEEVAVLVRDMTFEGGFAQEQNDIWEKPPIIRLLKLYDKVNNLLDGSWMSEEKRERYIEFTRALAHDVAENYGKLSIVKLASTF